MKRTACGAALTGLAAALTMAAGPAASASPATAATSCGQQLASSLVPQAPKGYHRSIATNGPSYPLLRALYSSKISGHRQTVVILVVWNYCTAAQAQAHLKADKRAHAHLVDKADDYRTQLISAPKLATALPSFGARYLSLTSKKETSLLAEYSVDHYNVSVDVREINPYSDGNGDAPDSWRTVHGRIAFGTRLVGQEVTLLTQAG